MKKYMLEYKSEVEMFIQTKLKHASRQEIDEFLSNFDTKIMFFQHERLIHLIVTVTFAVLEILSAIAMNFVFTPVLIALAILFLVLLIPYVFHYYFLENTVQEFYKLRDRIEAAKKSVS